MNRELTETWTRMLDGQPLSDAEVIALQAFLDHADREQKQQLLNDLATDDLLVEFYGDRDLEARSEQATAAFVDCVRQRISQPPTSVQPPPVIRPTTPVARGSEPKRVYRAETRARIVAATAASILLLVVSGALIVAHSNRKRQQAGGRPTTPGTPAAASQDAPRQPEQTTNTPDLVVPRSPEVVATDEPAVNRESATGDLAPDPVPSEMPERPEIVAVAVDDPARTGPVKQKTTPLISQSDSSSDSALLASVLDQSEAVWGDGFDPAAVDRSSMIELVSGTSQLRMADGAELSISGPTKLSLVDGNSVTLKEGSITALVPASATGFQIAAPGARIVDLGTVFSVDAKPSDPFTLVHVTEGKVDAYQPPVHPRGRERKTRMLAGKMKWFSRDGGDAFDWRLEVEFGDRDIQPTYLSIDGEEFDLGHSTSRTAALDRLEKSFQLATEQLGYVARGERFQGEVTVNDVSQRLLNRDHLGAAETLLRQRIREQFVAGATLRSPIEVMNELQQQLHDALRGN